MAALKLHKHSIGYEVNEAFRLFYNEKVVSSGKDFGATFAFQNDTKQFNIAESLNRLPYQFIDSHRLDVTAILSDSGFGEKRSFDDVVKKELEEEAMKQEVADSASMVMVNHARPDLYRKMIETGICYLRAGDSKGSLLVTTGFERLQYVLLHTNGENCQLFKLKTRGHFQIWTRETLQQYGFDPHSTSYYVVLHFDARKPIAMKTCPDLKEEKYTFKAKIRPLSDFMGGK